MLFVRKFFWILNLVTISLCAFFAASALGQIVLCGMPSPVHTVGVPDIPVRLLPDEREVKPIVERNIFCSTCSPVEESSAEPAAAESKEPAKAPPNLQLIATLMSPHGARARTYAVIRDTTADTMGLYTIGQALEERVLISDINSTWVLLLNHDRPQLLELEKTTNPSKTPRKPTGPRQAKAARTRRPMAGMGEISKGIRKLGHNRWEIQRQILDKVLGNTTLIARSARIVPSLHKGKPNGFRLFRIRPGSIYALLGMQNGDVVQAINGHPITTPDKALEVYTKLRRASFINIGFSRRGKKIAYEYVIR